MKTVLLILLALSLSVPGQFLINPYAFGAGGGGFDQSNLIFWMDLAGDAADDSGNLSGTPTEQNAPAYVTGPFSDANGAIQFTSSVDEHITIADEPSLTPSGAFTFIGWMRVTNGAGSGFWMGKYNPDGQRSFYFQWQTTSGGRLNIGLTNDGSTMEEESTGGNFEDDTWMHVAFVYDGTNTMNIYRDGNATPVDTEVWSTETGGMFDGTSTLFFGALTATTAHDIAFARWSHWGRALSTAEIATLYNGGSDMKFADLP